MRLSSRLGDDLQPLVGPAGDVREERDVPSRVVQRLPVLARLPVPLHYCRAQGQGRHAK